MSTRSYRSDLRMAWPSAAVAASSLVLVCVSGPLHAAAADAVYVRDHRAAKVFVAPVARLRDVIVVRETYQGEDGDAFTNNLYELDCNARTLRFIGGAAPGEPASLKDSEFYAGAYMKAHDALCNRYKDSAEWGD